MSGKEIVGPVKILEISQWAKNKRNFRTSKNLLSFAKAACKLGRVLVFPVLFTYINPSTEKIGRQRM